ncbi:hypothetical protein D8674_010259 [Pyrus ussuriensis x Pyrus communis]|uniref:Tf2-1-like SH3-like domain-containing protein n=1 Tax=Pyrus ussuriensis x Pyrus communis TaxID=2448454 RepID=A0A5N5FA80_9ROSA|nr:hypothetical protein D8674_010259 [Pyrus ussuriensis x Pyrus communis]
MPCHAPTTCLTTMDACLTAVEATLADLPNLLRNSIAAVNADLSAAISTDFNAKLAFFFEQFRREQSFVGGVGSSNPASFPVDPIPPLVPVTDDIDFRLLETPRHLVMINLIQSAGRLNFRGSNGCFFGGLKRELVYDVKLLRPASVHDAISIIVQVDAKLSTLRSHNIRTLPAPKVTPLPIMPPRPKTTNLPYRKLTLEEKWVMGHKCTHKQLLLLDVCDDGELCEENDEVVQAELQGMALGECAFYGTNAKCFLQTMKVLGSVKGQPMRILLDSGRYHCHTDLFALPLGGCDLVLGAQWLSTVSPILCDFQLLTMEFQQLNKEFYDSNLGVLLYSLESTPKDTSTLSVQQMEELQAVLMRFDAVFQIPSQLPPHKAHDHKIPLLQGSKPQSIRPYHYGPAQKDEIEKTVQELLKSGFIRPSHIHSHSLCYLLQQHELFVKKQKCSFRQHQVEYLGHIVSSEEVSMDPTKIQAILEWPAPKNVKELREFSGLTAMTSPQLLALPNFAEPFIVKCDTSILGIRAVLYQALGPRNQALSTYERELIAIVYARTNTPFQQKWVSKLLGLDYKVQYRHGKENIVADALSRVPRSPPLPELPLKEKGELLVVTYPYFGSRRTVFEEHHSTSTAGHEGVLKTYQRLKRVILVVVDKLSKYGHFIALGHPYTASRDPIFLSAFGREFFRLQGSKCLETYLRCFTSCKPKNYNTSFHTASRFTPFEIVYGYPPPHIVSYELGSAKLESVEHGLMAKDKMLTMLKNNLIIAQNRMKVQADKNRSERTFEVGDWVYLKLIPYQLQSLATHAYHKLHPKFYGPFEVLEKVGSVAYKLKLPETSKIHPVFHVSCLKKHVGLDVNFMPLLPLVTDDGLQAQEPASVLQRRVYKKNNAIGVQLLIQWKDKNVEESTWEDYDKFTAKFPGFKF